MNETRFGAIILAGGKSSRLGRDKAAQPLLGVPLLQRVVGRIEGIVSEVVIVKAKSQVLPDVRALTPLTVVEDLDPDSGPLAGLYAGLTALEADAAVAVACDMPLLQRPLLEELLRLLAGHDAVVPAGEDGRPQALCAIYSKACLGAIRARLDSGRLQLTALLEDLDVVEVRPETWRRFDPEGLSFVNVNTEEDLPLAEALLSPENAAVARSGLRCQVWYGSRQCRQPATHRSEHTGVLVCAMHASIWGDLYEEGDE
jgi:molybdenum cofactor guanylyltransferase